LRGVLLIDRSGERTATLKNALRFRGFDMCIEDQGWRAVQALRKPVPEWEFVVVVAGSTSQEDVDLLRELVEASLHFHQSSLPQFLFASTASCMPSLRIGIGKLGARYVRL